MDRLQRASRHAIRFEGEGLASGLYLYRLETLAFTRTRAMTLAK